jgi:tRNA(fMet)-specific endonuclease VapC
MKYILDTDLLSILFRNERPAADCLRARLKVVPPSDISTTIVNFQERIQGWMAILNKARTPDQILDAYEQLFLTLEEFRSYSVLPFDITCIALSRGATLLTRNLRDFRQVPGLTVEDWSR